MTKFIKVSIGLVADNYYNTDQIAYISEISSDQTDYKPLLYIKMNSGYNDRNFDFTLNLSFKKFHEWLNSDTKPVVLVANEKTSYDTKGNVV